MLGLLSLKHRAKAVLEHEMKGVGNQDAGKQFLQGPVTLAEKVGETSQRPYNACFPYKGWMCQDKEFKMAST